ncbi:MAG: chorismate-binding protein [Spirosomataceae bacterium]
MESNALENIKSFVHTSQTVSLSSGWQAALEMGCAVAIWQLPYQKEKQLIVHFNGSVSTTKIVLEDAPTGFAFSPFLNEEGKDTLFIEADLYYRFGEKGEILAEKAKEGLSLFQKEEWQKQSQMVATASQTAANEALNRPSIPYQPASKERYMRSVEAAVAAIQAGHLKKVVLSRTKEIALPTGLSPFMIFDRLCDKYPTAFVSMVYLPQLDQIWVGATPKRWFLWTRRVFLKPLLFVAGTQSAFDGNQQPIAPKQALWSQKEIEEQALVGRYIISCFKKIRVREYLEESTKSAVANCLIHLLSEYKVDTKAIRFQKSAVVSNCCIRPLLFGKDT